MASKNMLGEPRHRRDAPVGILRVVRIVDGHALRAPPPAAAHEASRSRACSRRSGCAAPACRPRRRIRCGGRCRDRRRSSSTGLPSGPHSNCSAIATVVCRSRSSGRPARRADKPRDRPAEPFEIMEAMARRNCRARRRRRRRTVFQLRMRSCDRAVLDVPMHGDVAQRADRAGVEHRLGALPGHDLMEIEIDHGRQPALRRPRAAWRARRQGRRPSAFRRTPACRSSSAAIAISACRLGSVAMATACDVLVLDQRAPVAIGLRRRRPRARASARARGIAAGERHHLAARVGAERRQVARCVRNWCRRCRGGSRSKALHEMSVFGARGMDLGQIAMLGKGVFRKSASR